MSGPPVAAQWALDNTVNGGLSIARGVMVAATTDNVQPLAILACEAFGNTLAMTYETLRKVDKELLPTPKPTLVQFLKATVGYSRDDCATQLGRSAAGMRFLGLAAAFVPTLGCFESAKIVDELLRESAADLTLLPTLRQLGDLMNALEPRSHRCGFAESVEGWRRILEPHLNPDLRNARSTLRIGSHPLDTLPSSKAISSLIRVFRQVARIGEASVTGATIHATFCAPWILAAVQWFIGPPALWYCGLEVISQAQAKITVDVGIPRSRQSDINVTIHHRAESISSLVNLGSSDGGWCRGMISREAYARRFVVQHLAFDEGDIPFLRNILRSAIPVFFQSGPFRNHKPLPSDGSGLHEFSLVSPFPTLPEIDSICDTLFPATSTEQSVQYSSTDEPEESLLLRVEKYFGLAETGCKCPESIQREIIPVTPGPYCPGHHILVKVGCLILEIVTLSLLEGPAPILVALPNLYDRSSYIDEKGQMSDSLHGRMQLKDVPTCASHWITRCRNLTGHRHSDTVARQSSESDRIYLISDNGRVTYPSVLDTLRLEEHGFATMTSLPGTLIYEGSSYHMAATSTISGSLHVPRKETFQHRSHVEWQVNVSSLHELTLNLSTISPEPDPKLGAATNVTRNHRVVDVSSTFRRIGRSVWLSRCSRACANWGASPCGADRVHAQFACDKARCIFVSLARLLTHSNSLNPRLQDENVVVREGSCDTCWTSWNNTTTDVDMVVVPKHLEGDDLTPWSQAELFSAEPYVSYLSFLR